MSFSRRRLAATSAIAASAVITGVGVATGASGHPAATDPERVITVTQAHGQLTVDGGTTIDAGRVTFSYTAAKGDHTLQAAALHQGYSPAQLGKDVSAGLDKGNVKAIRRLDKNVAWLGGAESTGAQTGSFSTVLPEGTVYLFDQDSNARAQLTVTSSSLDSAAPASTTTVTVTPRLRWHTPAVLPANGWIQLRDNSTEPHVFEAQRVKESTTAKKVRAFIKQGARSQPKWALKASAGSGVFSPGTTTELHTDLPAGKYLILCFWPSKKNGMPHFMMGMWKLVHLQ